MSWGVYYTDDGTEYYYNSVTQETTWTKPDELKTADDMDQAGDWFWIPDESECYVAAKLVKEMYGGAKKMQLESGETREVKSGVEVYPLKTSELKKHMDDLVQMDYVNEATILHNLRVRFKKDIIYTNIGTILISVNPFKQLPLYTPKKIDEYAHRGTKDMPPHIFNISGAAYDNVVMLKRDQSILISGESGAGKTEATKVALQYFAEVAGSTNGVENNILLANPILEAFGNAKTLRNNNSSRFGKWVEIHFDVNGRICGAKTINYLLEKSRVVVPPVGERNYHAFYQLAAGAEDDLRGKWKLGQPDNYLYLTRCGDTTIPGLNDAEEYVEMTNAMRTLGFESQEKENVLQLCAAILHMGNVEFAPDGTSAEGSVVQNKDELSTAAQLLSVDEAGLSKGITHKCIAIRGQAPTYKPLNPEQSADLRNSLCKALYGNMFNWLVQRINKCMEPSERKTTVIGVLDIFGFEIFETNSFEQLCINFANEKLQQHFNQHTFKLEEELYQSEKIKYDKVTYIDNQPVLDLIEMKATGILARLDEEGKMPRGSDESFLSKLCDTYDRKHQNFQKPLRPPCAFLIKHYAGDVVYGATGFLEKNKDQISEELIDLMSNSKIPFVAQLFPTSGAKKTSLGSQFNNQLSSLMSTLNATSPHYIRCVKSNSLKVPGVFDASMTLQQLRYSGVFEAVRIRKSGFPFRLPHAEFFKKYRCLCKIGTKFSTDDKKNCETILDTVGEKNTPDLQFGVTRVLYRSDPHRKFTLLLNLEKQKRVLIIQSAGRAMVARKILKQLKQVRPKLEAAIKARDKAKLESAIAEASNIIYQNYYFKRAKKVLFCLEQEEKVKRELAELVKQDPEKVFDKLKDVVERAIEIELDSPEFHKAKDAVEKIAERRQCREDLQKGVSTHDLALLEAAIEKAAKLGFKDSEDVVKDAKQELERLRKETRLAKEVSEAMQTGRVTVREDCEYDHSTVDVSKITTAVQALESFGAQLAASKKTLAHAQLTVRMRNAILAEDWDSLEGTLVECSKAEYSSEEVASARKELTLKRGREQVTDKLNQGMAEMDEGILELAIEQGTELKMEDMPVYQQGLETLQWIQTTRQWIQTAMANVDEEQLVYAVQLAESGQYHTQEVQMCRELKDKVVEYSAESQEALDILDRPRMEAVAAAAEAIGFESENIVKIKELLGEPMEKFLQLQLKLAMKMEDRTRITKVTIQLKDLFFSRFGDQFAFQNFGCLKTVDMWVNQKLNPFGKDELRATFLSFTKNPIHASLTRLDGPAAKLATKLFKNILGVMGDKQFQYPEALAQELIQCCLEHPCIRDEIFCQLIKQLSRNPSQESEKKGWQLMGFCLVHFPPGDDFANYLEIYLRKANKMKMVEDLHQTLYGGAKQSAPTVEEVKSRLYTRRFSVSAY